MPALLMPNVGEGIQEGTVVRWLKQEGDHVELDEPILEVETDKAIVEVPSPFAGVLAHILVVEGETAKIGAPLAEFQAAEAEAPRPPAQAPQPPSPPPTPAAPFTSKAPGSGDGRLGEPMPSPPPEPGQVMRPSSPQPRTDRGAMGRQRHYSPVVQKLAAEHGLNLELVEGSGIGGRVTRADVMRYLSARAGSTEQAEPDARRPDTPLPPAGEPVSAEAATPLSSMRRVIAERMSESHATIPTAWMAVEADVTGLVTLRGQMRDAFMRREGINLAYLPFLVQAIVAALMEHPPLNATYTDEGITVHRAYHIGIAVSTDAGLMVPVIRNADRRPVAELAHEIARLAAACRNRTIGLQELRGATFTVDNTGAFGSMISQPIIVPGEVAIITTEAIRRELRVMEDGSFAVRNMMNLAISFDHRALDGSEVGRFMADVRARIEAIGAEQAAS